MEELTCLLNNIEDSYYDFITARLHYAEKTQERQDTVLKYLKNNPKVKSYDVIKFVSEQKDFFEDAAYVKVS
ncbi:MAG: hypothetical protein NC309_03910 [Ruminococcus sp.]|nr:hypothetical protein [Ruminococcus sp.]